MHGTILIYDSRLLTYYTIFLSGTRISRCIDIIAENDATIGLHRKKGRGFDILLIHSQLI
jgi:hypothetical protein